MTAKKREHQAGDRLDSLGRALVRASADNEQAGEAAASAPFLYTRLRARINAERLRREEGETWRALFGVIWRAVPAMALVAVLAVVLFLSSTFSRTIGGYNDDLLSGNDTGVERMFFATDTQPLSSDDVLATIMNDEERGVSK
jgi:hypothetical protein